MRISTYIKSFLRFKLKLVTLVTYCSIELFFFLFLIFCYFFLNSTLPPLAFAHLQQTPLLPPPPPHKRNVFRWGWVQVGVGSGGVGFSWGMWVQVGEGGGVESSTESFCNLSLGFEMD